MAPEHLIRQNYKSTKIVICNVNKIKIAGQRRNLLYRNGLTYPFSAPGAKCRQLRPTFDVFHSTAYYSAMKKTTTARQSYDSLPPIQPVITRYIYT